MDNNQLDGKELSKWLPAEILKKFEVFNYNHAAEILSQSFPHELKEIVDTLNGLTISEDEIRKAGGNESPIPPKFSKVLDPKGWKEIRISGDLLIKFFQLKKGGYQCL